jgi:prophage regulatory protein
MEQQNPNTRMIRLPEVMNKTGLGRSSIYKMMDHGKFPKCHKIGERAVAWLEREIDMWIKLRTFSKK